MDRYKEDCSNDQNREENAEQALHSGMDAPTRRIRQPSALTVERHSNLFKGEAGMITSHHDTDECRSHFKLAVDNLRNAKPGESWLI